MRQYQVAIALKLEAPRLEQIRAVHPGIVLHPIAEEVRLLQSQTAPPQEKAQAEARLNGVLAQAEIFLGLRALPDLLARSPRLRWIHFPSHGVDHLRGDVLVGEVLVTTGRGSHANAVAEHAVAMMLALVRELPRLTAQQREHRWEVGRAGELDGQTLGLVGLGSIGQRVAELARAFHMRIIATKRNLEESNFPPGLVDELVPPTALNHLLSQSDFVLVGVPYTKETRKLIGEAQLRAMKPTAYLLNIARGGVVDEEALIRALREKWFAGAGLDVFAREPLSPESPLWDLPNVLVTPHMAGLSHRFQEHTTGLFCENLRRYTQGQPLLNVLDRARGY